MIGLLQKFIEEWVAHEEWWFHTTPEVDAYLTDHYESLIDIPEAHIKNKLHAVIVYDQLTRHIFRNTQSNHIISFFTQKAITCATTLDLSSLTVVEWCFAMLPIRHGNNIFDIHRLMTLSWIKIVETRGHCQIKRFLKATYERCPIQDQRPLVIDFFSNNYTDSYSHEKFSHILHFCPTKYVSNSSLNDLMFTRVRNVISSMLNMNEKHRNITVSLSGGVDSMVCLHILDDLKKALPISLQAVHINYSNRTTADEEERFVVSWATSKGINVTVRRIREINRSSCMEYDLRNTYETYTRDVRYATYKVTDSVPFVVLGHNKDDCLENIFQNISHHTKYENLCGMDYVSKQDGITFLRPLLSISKDDIVKFARGNGIPYLQNSTPEWSQRGQIRNKVVPVLDAWNPELIPGLHQLSDYVKDMYDISRIYVSKQISRFKRKNNITSATYDIDDISLESEFTWRSMIGHLFPQELVSKKSMRCLLQRIISTDKRKFDIRFNLNKNVQVRCEIRKDLVTICFANQYA